MKRTPLRKVSKKQSIRISKLKVIRDEIFREQQHKCYCCGERGSLDLAHIIRRSASIRLIDNKLNTIGLCRACHRTLDDSNLQDILSLGNIDLILSRMKELDESYYNRFTNR